jgi:2-methylfumaryl-CoA isomerase
LYWTALNKGKRSIAVNLRDPEGQELVAALATRPGRSRGVVLENTLNRSWLSYESLSARRDDLIHVRVQGHADGRPAVDYTVNASVGLPDMTGPEMVGTPVNHVLPAWDLLCGSTAALAVISALREREHRGVGAQIEVALADVALAGVASLGWVAQAELEREDRPRHGNHVYGSFGVDFATADGRRVMVVALTEGQWHSLREVTGTSDVFVALEKALAVDFDEETDRYTLRETIAAILRPWFEARTLADVAVRLDEAKVLWGPYRTLHQLLRETSVDGNHQPPLQLIDQPGVGTVVAAASPLRWSGTYGGVRPAPLLGADTEDVLSSELGLTEAEIAALQRSRVVACG